MALGLATWLPPGTESTLSEYSRGQDISYHCCLSSQLSLPRDRKREVLGDRANKQKRETKGAQDFRAESRAPVPVLTSEPHVTN